MISECAFASNDRFVSNQLLKWFWKSSYFLLTIFRSRKQPTLPSEDRIKLAELDKNIIKRKAQLYEIEQSLPQKNSTYLKVSNKLLHRNFYSTWCSLIADNPRKCQRLDFEPRWKGSIQGRLWEVQADPQLHWTVHVGSQSSHQLSCPWTGFHVPPRLVLLYAYDSRIDSKSERLQNQRLVAVASLHFNSLRGGASDLAARRFLATLQNTIYVF